MAWYLTKKFRFEAAHRLPHHDGKCQRLHGHSWEGQVVCRFDDLIEGGAKDGMGRDYADISAPVKAMVEEFLDHHYLNETLPLESPTSELVARWVWEHLEPVLTGLHAVVIKETCTSACRYSPRD